MLRIKNGYTHLVANGNKTTTEPKRVVVKVVYQQNKEDKISQLVNKQDRLG